jgi:predicted RNA-binding Zn-ribbon protein involved in translation (DUF1610 family)
MSEEEQRLERHRIAAKKFYYKNKANEYLCPDCGRMINKSTARRHDKSTFHKYTVLLKTTNQEPIQST